MVIGESWSSHCKYYSAKADCHLKSLSKYLQPNFYFGPLLKVKKKLKTDLHSSFPFLSTEKNSQNKKPQNKYHGIPTGQPFYLSQVGCVNYLGARVPC